MIQIKIKRVYDDPEPGDGYRVLVDRLWPRGIKKACLSYDEWAKEITPSPGLRTWFHDDISRHRCIKKSWSTRKPLKIFFPESGLIR